MAGFSCGGVRTLQYFRFCRWRVNVMPLHKGQAYSDRKITYARFFVIFAESGFSLESETNGRFCPDRAQISLVEFSYAMYGQDSTHRTWCARRWGSDEFREMTVGGRQLQWCSVRGPPCPCHQSRYWSRRSSSGEWRSRSRRQNTPAGWTTAYSSPAFSKQIFYA